MVAGPAELVSVGPVHVALCVKELAVRRYGLIGVCLLVVATGCAPMRLATDGPSSPAGSALSYAKHRFEDAFEMVDLGLTFSTKPGFALYGDFASVAPGGYGHVDGYFLGVGGGRIGPMRHYQGSLGLLAWGYEEVGFGSFDKIDLTTLNYQTCGALGLLTPPYGRPASAPS
jgi:hypothetical protein